MNTLRLAALAAVLGASFGAQLEAKDYKKIKHASKKPVCGLNPSQGSIDAAEAATNTSPVTVRSSIWKDGVPPRPARPVPLIDPAAGALPDVPGIAQEVVLGEYDPFAGCMPDIPALEPQRSALEELYAVSDMPVASLSWSTWLKRSASVKYAQIKGFAKEHPALFATIVIGTPLVVAAAVYTYKKYKNSQKDQK